MQLMENFYLLVKSARFFGLYIPPAMDTQPSISKRFAEIREKGAEEFERIFER